MLLAIYGRAKASRMFPDILRGDEAVRIVEGMDYDFAKIDKSYGTEYASLCCLLRAKRLDDRYLAYIREHPRGTVFILASGLFYYFREEQVRELICRIAEHFPSGEIFFDAQSKTAVKISNRMVRKTGNKGSEMHFFVNDAQKMRSWSTKIRKVESVSFFDDLWKKRRFKLSTKINMWGLEKLKMGSLVSVTWGTAK
jgi:O-methyltransferase involved in polyketide biosynthesis